MKQYSLKKLNYIPWLLFLSVIALCTGCTGKKSVNLEKSTDNDPLVFKAIVVTQNDNSLSVINLDKDEGFGRFDPIHVNVNTKNLSLARGDIIKVTFDGMIAESYPCQISGDKIKILEKAENKWPAQSLIPEDYTADEAVLDNCFVLKVSGEMLLKERIQTFQSNTIAGIMGFLRTVMYTDEGDPIVTDILYDGKKYYVYEDFSRDKFSGSDTKLYKYQYQYLNTLDTGKYTLLYLADRNDITVAEYEKSVSGGFEEAIDLYPICYENKDTREE